MARKITKTTMRTAMGKGDPGREPMSDREAILGAAHWMMQQDPTPEQMGDMSRYKAKPETAPAEDETVQVAASSAPASEPVNVASPRSGKTYQRGSARRKAAREAALTAAPARDPVIQGADPFAPEPAGPAVRGAQPEVRPGYKLVKAREVLPHVSVYLHPRVIARFKEIAAVEGKKAHAVYLEALDQYLTQNHGVTLESLGRE